MAARLRVLKTGITAEIQAAEGREGATTDAFEKAVTEGRSAVYNDGLDGTLLGTGQNVGLIYGLTSVADLINDIVSEYNAILEGEL